MKTFLVALITLLGLPTFAVASETMHSFKVGVGFMGNATGYGLGIDLATPRLFSINNEEARRKLDVHLFLDGGYLMTNNVFQIAGSYVSATNYLVTVGIMGQMIPSSDSVFSPYSKIGVDVLFPDNQTSSKSTSVGMRAAIGCDFIFHREEKTILGTQDSSFFIEGALVYLHRHADRAAGSPTLLEGFMPRIGYRSHF